MKKGDRRIHVAVIEKKVVDGKEVKVKVGEKDIYERNPYSGVGAFNMSWQDRNKLPRPDSKRQKLLRGEGKNLNVATAGDMQKLEKEFDEMVEAKKTLDTITKELL